MWRGRTRGWIGWRRGGGLSKVGKLGDGLVRSQIMR